MTKIIHDILNAMHAFRQKNYNHPTRLRIGPEERKELRVSVEWAFSFEQLPPSKEKFMGMEVVEERFMRGFKVE